ncbi:hypothetical protein A8B79_08465 [Balneola sp. EhC07]|nr:hypothetical protein A8B79_08465 [Balneola sp. EhC07]
MRIDGSLSLKWFLNHGLVGLKDGTDFMQILKIRVNPKICLIRDSNLFTNFLPNPRFDALR